MKKHVWRAFVFNPLVVILYGIACNYLAELMWYGGVSRRAPVILMGFFLLCIWFGWCVLRSRQPNNGTHEPTRALAVWSKWWFRLAIIGMIVITMATGYSMFQSASGFQGRLSFYLHDWFNTRYVTLEQKNVYEDGLDGLFEEIDQSVPLPEELYVSSPFEATADANGEITSLYASIYGKGEDGEAESFLIDYDRAESKKIRVRLNGYAAGMYEESDRMQPLFDIVSSIPFDQMEIGRRGELEIYYEGVRNFGYNTDGILFFNKEGQVDSLAAAYGRGDMEEIEIAGYSVSITKPDEEVCRFMEFTPHLADSTPLVAEPPGFDEAEQSDELFYHVDNQLGYHLKVVDAATGSRFYELNRTLDGGSTWEQLNPDPFLGSMGVASGLTFIDEQLGFASLSRNGGSEAQLYRTLDGGHSFERVALPEIEAEIPLTDGQMYTPFDYPEMPYMENGILHILVGQGADGDYNAGRKILLQSYDLGMTWEFIEEQIEKD